MTVYFSDASPEQVGRVLDEVAERVEIRGIPQVYWLFPGEKDLRVSATFIDQHDVSTRGEPREVLGAEPQCMLRLNLDGKHLSQAADAAKLLIVHLVSAFDGAVEDEVAGTCWSGEEFLKRSRQ